MKMVVYIHAGLGKAGSTSIQNAFFENSEKLLLEHGIYYSPRGSEFPNHFEFSRLLFTDPEAADIYIGEMLDAAIASSARTVLISSEDLIGLPHDQAAFQKLQGIIRKYDHTTFRFIFVLRSLKGFLRSNVVQMMTSGATLYDNRLAAWTIQSLKAFKSLGFPVDSMSLEHSKNALLKNFFAFLSDAPCPLAERRDNLTPRRPNVFHAILGQIIRLRANAANAHPNGLLMRDEAAKLTDHYDSFKIWDDPDKPYCEIGSAGHFVNFFEQFMEASIAEYVESSIAAVPEGDLAFYKKLLNPQARKRQSVKTPDLVNHPPEERSVGVAP
jgi:hypothetical protein